MIQRNAGQAKASPAGFLHVTADGDPVPLQLAPR
jgi:hypothetical protein